MEGIKIEIKQENELKYLYFASVKNAKKFVELKNKRPGVEAKIVRIV